MKFSFSPVELNYLDEKITGICKILSQRDVDTGFARLIHKIRYKFKTNALACFLSIKERQFLMELLAYRQGDLMKVQATSSEVELVQGLIEKVEL